MKIAQIVSGYGQGGLEKHVRDLSWQVSAFGHEVVVFADMRLLDSLPDTVERVPVRFDRSRHHPLLLLELLVKLRACQCDVIHAHANKAASLLAILKPWLDTPAMATLHNQKRDVGAFRKLDHVITVSRQLAHAFPRDQVSVVYNGIGETSGICFDIRQRYQLPAGLPVLCAAGRLVDAKGFDVLLDAIDGLPVSLVVAGTGEASAKLAQRASTLSAPTHVRFLGYQDDVSGLMASSDAVVIASRREGFSYVFSEAVSSRTCVLSTDVPVANEVLPGELIVPVGDVSAMRAKLIELLASFARWNSLMETPRQIVRALMTQQAMATHTLEVYRSVVAQHARFRMQSDQNPSGSRNRNVEGNIL